MWDAIVNSQLTLNNFTSGPADAAAAASDKYYVVLEDHSCMLHPLSAEKRKWYDQEF